MPYKEEEDRDCEVKCPKGGGVCGYGSTPILLPIKIYCCLVNAYNSMNIKLFEWYKPTACMVQTVTSQKLYRTPIIKSYFNYTHGLFSALNLSIVSSLDSNPSCRNQSLPLPTAITVLLSFSK